MSVDEMGIPVTDSKAWYCLYKFPTMPFGMTAVPTSLLNMMNQVTQPLTVMYTRVFNRFRA